MVTWSWGVVSRCRCVVRGGRLVCRCGLVRGRSIAVAWLLLGLLLPRGGPVETDQVEEASEGKGDCMNHVTKEGSCLQKKLGLKKGTYFGWNEKLMMSKIKFLISNLSSFPVKIPGRC